MAKHIIQGKVRTHDHKIFTVQKVAASEQDILLHFGRKVNYEVVKLSVRDLPSKDAHGKKITWINNFGVKDSSGKYVKKVKYSVFLPAPKRKSATFIYYDHGRLKWDKTPTAKGRKPARARMVQVDFNTGDPAVGWG